MKSKNYLFSCFLWFQKEVFKVKLITHAGSGSRTRKKLIPAPGAKKAPDLGRAGPWACINSEVKPVKMKDERFFEKKTNQLKNKTS
jgi:hypothetical protein